MTFAFRVSRYWALFGILAVSQARRLSFRDLVSPPPPGVVPTGSCRGREGCWEHQSVYWTESCSPHRVAAVSLHTIFAKMEEMRSVKI